MRDRRWKNVGAYLMATRRLGRIAGIEIQFDSFFGRGNDAADRVWLFNNKQEEEQWTIQNIQTFSAITPEISLRATIVTSGT